ncbi:MAG: type I DNA topoisomerase [Kiritimatiellae bacterium]|nr:type I DNA topoisomerase [Kiritimatiellia bacterium]
MSSTLVIVESPAKARTLARFLGRDVTVRASMGHIRDLPESEFGVDIEKGFRPTYVVIPSRAKVVRELKAAVKTARRVVLAPDPDREGEAIAWHLREVLAPAAEGLEFVRVSYHEITERAIRQALAAPRDIDMAMVNAQQARRILDRIVGYRVSPFLRRRIAGAASAGRVQTAALRLVCDREKEIRNFRPEEYWVIGVRAAKRVEPRTPFIARLAKVGGEKPAIRTAADADALRRELDDRPLRVVTIERKTVERRAPPPFVTSTLQQAASREAGFSPSKTMRIAQTLYEGVDLGDGPVGLITYMRTDSVAVAAEAREACRRLIAERYGPDYVPATPNVFRSKAHAQQAHEAIRPTDVSRTPESVAARLKPEERRLYELIWRRFVASQMAPARLAQLQVEIEAVPPASGGRPIIFRASASNVEFPGYLAAAGTEAVAAPTPGAEGEEEAEEAQTLPPLEEGEWLDRVGDWLAEQKFTKPPRRYSDATLVRAMEERGIGRPSTYAATVQLLYDRRYVQREKRTIAPTELGMAVNDYLAERLPELFDIGFTAAMEEQLDEVEEGRVDWREMLRRFHEQFQAWLTEARGADPHPDATRRVLELLGQVREWIPPRVPGRRAFDERKFVESLRRRLEEGGALTERQAGVLRRIAWTYADQVPELAALLKELGWPSPAAEPAPPSPAEQDRVKQLFAALEGVRFEPARRTRGRSFDDAKFVASLKRQFEGGRPLSARQMDALVQIARRYGVEPSAGAPPAAGDAPSSAEERAEWESLLQAAREIREWKAPSQSRGRTWDDRQFFESLERQFREKGRLSPRQTSALRRLLARYGRTAGKEVPPPAAQND